MKTKCYHDDFSFATTLLETKGSFFIYYLHLQAAMWHNDTHHNDIHHNNK